MHLRDEYVEEDIPETGLCPDHHLHLLVLRQLEVDRAQASLRVGVLIVGGGWWVVVKSNE